MPLLGPYGVLSGVLPVSSTKGSRMRGGVVLLVGFLLNVAFVLTI